DYVITSRLDNDDALHRDYMGLVRREIPRRHRAMLGFPNGLCLDGGRLLARHYPLNPFPSMIERPGGPGLHRGLMTVWSGDHDRVPLLASEFRQAATGPMWLQVVHERNLLNRPRGDDVPLTREALAPFLPAAVIEDHVAGLLLASRGRGSAQARPAAPATRDIRVPAADESVAVVRAATVEAVAGAGLCVGCGLCERVCTHGAATVEETPGGLLRARVDADRCTACGECAAVCPGWHLEPGLLPPGADPFAGRVLAACIGQAADAQVLADGQSGGVVTALLGHLLATGRIGRALVTEMPRDGSLRARAFLADGPEGLGRAQGSKYCPTAACAALPDGLGDDGAPPVAFVGVGCHVHGLRNALARRPEWARGIALTVGLFCDHVLGFGAMDHLIGKAGLAAADAVGFEYRSKRWRGWPGDVRVLARGGREEFLDRKHRTACKDQFTPARCRLCFDKFNVLADVAVGDAWGLAEDGQGTSVVLARTPRGLEALASAERAGALRLATVPAEAVFEAQRLDKRRAEWAAYTAAWKQIGGLAPDFGLGARHHEPAQGVSLVSYRRELRRAAAAAAERAPAPAGVTADPG
ncbi:MAG: Coenzyme F420 hydrogenase/dehydrogenase, beta subunit C-terminal domain, partial [Planctomycetes bacterium]|nr:Coenzyme F420 hydrogenase/dehydrogenase, beta subunit C-terminal domain [Planctomycetota bacterium]